MEAEPVPFLQGVRGLHLRGLRLHHLQVTWPTSLAEHQRADPARHLSSRWKEPRPLARLRRVAAGGGTQPGSTHGTSLVRASEPFISPHLPLSARDRVGPWPERGTVVRSRPRSREGPTGVVCGSQSWSPRPRRPGSPPAEEWARGTEASVQPGPHSPQRPDLRSELGKILVPACRGSESRAYFGASWHITRLL